MFAEEFLTWQAANTEDHAARLSSYMASNMDRHAGWVPRKQGTAQQAKGAWVHSIKQVSDTRWLVTVAARVARSDGEKALPEETIYLGIPVGRTADGLMVYDFPSIMPGSSRSEFTEPLYFGNAIEDRDGRVKILLEAFFRSYLSESGEIGYFVAPGTQLKPIRSPWSFEGLSKLVLIESGAERWALADVILVDPVTGAAQTCRYTVGVTEREGQWYITQITQRGE